MNRRVKYLIDKKAQLGFFFSLLLFSFVLIGVTYLSVRHPEYFFDREFLERNRLWIILLLNVAFIAFLLYASLRFSHRLVGAVYRLIQTTRLVATGDLTARAVLRKSDFLLRYAASFNEMVEALGGHLRKERRKAAEAAVELRNLAQEVRTAGSAPPDTEQLSQRLEDLSRKVSSVLAGITTDQAGDLAAPERAAELPDGEAR